MKKNTLLALLLLNLSSFSAFSVNNKNNIIIEESEPAPMPKTLSQINIFLKNYTEFFDQNQELLKFLALIIEKTKGTIFEKMDLAKKFIETSKELVPDSNDRDHFVKLTYKILKNTTSSLNDYINLFTFIYKIEPTQFDNIESMIKNMLQQNNVKSTNNIISFIKTFNAASEEGRRNILKWQKNILSFIPHEYKDEKSFPSCIQSIANDPSLTFSEPLKKFIHLISKKDHNSKANPDVLFKIILHTSEADFNKGMPLVEKLFTTHARWGYSDCVSISSYILERAMSPEFLERFNFIYTKSKNNHWDAKTLADCVEQIYQLNENEFNKIKPQTIAANLDFYLQKNDVLFNAKLFLDSVIFEDFESKDIPRSTLMALWENGTTRHSYSMKLADLLFCMSEQSDDDIKSSILHSLWKHKEFSKKYCIKIVDFLFTLPEYEQKNIQFDILKELWTDPETKELHHESLSNMFIDFLQHIKSSEDINYIDYIISEILNCIEIKQITKDKLIDVLFLMCEQLNINIKSFILKAIWKNKELCKKHCIKIVDFLFALPEYNNKNIQFDMLKALWKDPETRQLHHEALSNMFLDFLQNIASSEDKIYIRYITFELLSDEETKQITKDKLFNLLPFMYKQSKYNIKSSILNTFLKHKELYKKHYIKIFNFLLNPIENNINNIKFDIFKELWTDSKTEQLHHEALSNMFIDFLQNISSSKDTNYIYYIIQELLNYPEIKQITKDKLIDLFLEHIQNNSIIEENYKIFIELTKNEKILKNNKSILIKIFKEYIKNFSNIEELKNKFNTEGNTVRHHFLRNTEFDRFNIFLKKIYIPRIDSYIIFGHPFQKTYNQFILYFWPIMNNALKITLCHNIMDIFGADNPRVQELLFLYARENINKHNPTLIFANLLKKLKEPYTHNLSIEDAILIKNGTEEIVHATINPEIFSYLPISQDALANLDDVDAILGDLNTIENAKLRNIIKAVQSDDEFQSYFMAPFSEEAIMLQAMIKKFKEMKKDGKERLITLMHQMYQCKKGKNQAIWDHYSIESKLLFTADLKTITDWLMRLRHIPEENLPAPYKTKSKWVDLINMIIKQDHIFRRHLTDFQTEDAQRLKGLLGYLRYLEQDIDPANHDQLNKNLKNVLEVLVQLSNPDDFYQNLTKLCTAYKIYLPANKFGDHLSINSINVLIQNLKEKDIEGRGDLHKLQTEMDHFVKNQDFIDLLNNFNDENGQKLRELIGGYIINGWSVGLLNLMDLSNTSTLYEAVDEMFKHVNIDKDVSLSWANLKKIIIKEIIDLKRQSINALAEKIVRISYAEIPHYVAYLESLLGGAIGLRNTKKAPDFDSNPPNSKLTSKSLQEALDLFHEQFTPSTIINHLASMISENKLSIIDPKTGINIISDLIRMAAQEQLNIDQTDDLLDLLYDEDSGNPKPLAFILLLMKLEILKETGESDNIIIKNILTLD
ncbi:MAG: hypothetical protein Q8L85_10080 [Alphaproteobacteria bacterium]|nr:hypothetical protein [Alphaproteobacteria bacterium]